MARVALLSHGARMLPDPGDQVAAMAEHANSFESDISANRAARKYSGTEQARRVMWGFGCWLIRLSPRPMFGWRRFVLRLFGARMGAGANVYPSSRIYMPWNFEMEDGAALGDDVFIYSLGRVRIGRGATVSYRAHICAGSHDLSVPSMPLLKPPVVVEANAWIGTDAFIGPGVTIGAGAVVGARAVVVRDVPPLAVVAGNPAKVVGQRRVASAGGGS